MKQKLQAKDLITVGIFSAIMLIVCMAASMIGYIPIFIPLLSIIVPVIGGIPFMLFLTKVKKFGMVTIMGIIYGIIFGLMGHGLWIIAFGPIFGILADLVFRSGKYSSFIKSLLGYGVFSMWIMGNFIPIIVTRSNYFDTLVSGYGKEYAQTLMRYMPDWILLPLLIACFIGGILGGLLGRALLKKHFIRAGIA